MNFLALFVIGVFSILVVSYSLFSGPGISFSPPQADKLLASDSPLRNIGDAPTTNPTGEIPTGDLTDGVVPNADNTEASDFENSDVPYDETTTNNEDKPVTPDDSCPASCKNGCDANNDCIIEFPDPCDSCANDEICVNNECIAPQDPCDLCGEGEVCVNDICVVPEINPCSLCPIGWFCVDDICVEPEPSDPCSSCPDEWSCVNNICVDSNNDNPPGGTTGNNNPPNNGQSCTPSWSCSSWGECSGGLQRRTCEDSNSCGSNIPEARSCSGSGSGSNSEPEQEESVNGEDGQVLEEINNQDSIFFSIKSRIYTFLIFILVGIATAIVSMRKMNQLEMMDKLKGKNKDDVGDFVSHEIESIRGKMDSGGLR